MSGQPAPRYTRRQDSHIAYQLLGEGPFDSVVMGTGTAPIESVWELPAAAEFLEHLASFSRVILFDRRGIGASDPLAPDEEFSAEGHAADAEAVLAEVRGSNVAAIGLGLTGAAAICLAANRPDLISRLVLLNGSARNLVADDYPIGSDPDSVDPNTEGVVWGDPDVMLSVIAPSAMTDMVYRNWYEQAGRRGAGPAVAEAHLRSLLNLDVRDRLADIVAPTLVLHAEKNRVNPLPQAEYLVSEIADARLVVLDGSDALVFVGDYRRVADEIEEFVTGVRRGPSPSQRVAAVMFTDIVESTAQAATLGDHGWKDVMDRHDHSARLVVERFGGSVVKSTGDGQLATFETPSAAMRAATALLEEVQRDLGLTLRAGVHLGEIEKRGNDVTGLAVNVAARVTDLAGDGEVWVTDSTRRATLGSEHVFERAGVFDLKGVPDQWEICRLAL